MTSDVSIGETASAASFFLADGLVITGSATGKTASPKDLEEVEGACSLPVFIGSGVTPDNVINYESAFGYIVGSYLKKDGQWQNEMDEARLHQMSEAVKR